MSVCRIFVGIRDDVYETESTVLDTLRKYPLYLLLLPSSGGGRARLAFQSPFTNPCPPSWKSLNWEFPPSAHPIPTSSLLLLLSHLDISAPPMIIRLSAL